MKLNYISRAYITREIISFNNNFIDSLSLWPSYLQVGNSTDITHTHTQKEREKRYQGND